MTQLNVDCEKLQEEKPPFRPQVKNSKVNINLKTRSPESSDGLKKSPKHIKHAFENGEFVKMRAEDERADMSNMETSKWCWVDKNRV
ncbi:hypothetical protein R6Q59_017844, partial [Mikania micrantha]